MAKIEPGALIPQMRLDELLSELQVRPEAVLATRDRVHALLNAVVAVGSDLDLETAGGFLRDRLPARGRHPNGLERPAR